MLDRINVFSYEWRSYLHPIIFPIILIYAVALNPTIVLADSLEVIPGVEGAIRSHHVSGDGSRVVFTSSGNPTAQNGDGNRELFVYEVASKQIHQLTHTTSQPSYSTNSGGLPNLDATRIVFTSRFNLAGGGEQLSGRDLFLAAVNYSTSVPSVTFRRLTNNVGNAHYAYSGNGHMIGLISNFNPVGRNSSHDFQVFRINLDPAPATLQLTEMEGGVTENLIWMGMDINYTGSRIAFTSTLNLRDQNADGNQEIYYVTDSGHIGQVTETPANTYNRDPSLSAYTQVVFRSNADITGDNPDGNFELFRASDSYAAANQITDTTGGDDNFGGANENPKFNQSGDSVVFTSNRDLVAGSNTDRNREIFQATISANPFTITFEQLTDTSNPYPGTRFENDYADIDNLARVIAFNSDLNPEDLTGVLFLLQRETTVPTIPPRIDTFYPRYGGPDVPVRLIGRRFTGATSVTFGSLAAASFNVLSDTAIEAVVPSDVIEAPITVTTPAGNTTSSVSFGIEQLIIVGEEFNQGMVGYPAVAGKDAVVRAVVHTQNTFGAWAISSATLTITSPSGQVSTIEPRMYNQLIQNSSESLSELNNINFHVPGSAIAEAGDYTFRIQALTAGQTVVDRTITKTLTRTRDVVLIIQSMMRAPDNAEFRLILQELEHFSRMHPARAGIGGIRLVGEPAGAEGLRVGYVFPPMFSAFDGDDRLANCRRTSDNHCWGIILQKMNELREAFNAINYYEAIEFGSVAMPRDRIISTDGDVQDCATMRSADGYGNYPGHASWIRLCGINTTLAHEVGHNIGLIPAGAANSDGGSHSVNSSVSDKTAFNLTRWEHIDPVMAAMCSPACGPNENVFFEDSHNGQPVDYPWLVDGRRIGTSVSRQLPLTRLATAPSGKLIVSDIPTPPVAMTEWNGPRLFISAFINSKGEFTLQQLSAMPKGHYLSGFANKGMVKLVLRDRHGKVIKSEFLASMKGLPGDKKYGTPGNFYNIIAVRPLPAKTASAEILFRNKVVHRLKPGSNPPSLRIKRQRVLKSKKRKKEKILLEWIANDKDGDTLTYRIDYSREGSRFIPLLLDLRQTTVAIPLNQLPGGRNIRFRITASDGFNSSSIVTNRIRLPGHKPIAAITSINENDRFLQHVTIELRGLAFDLEDGVMGKSSGNHFLWLLDDRKVLGRGASLRIKDKLNPGKHTITLEVRDKNGMKAVTRRNILIQSDSDRDRLPDHFERKNPWLNAYMPYDHVKRHKLNDLSKLKQESYLESIWRYISD